VRRSYHRITHAARWPTRARAIAFAVIATLVLGAAGLLIKDALFRAPLPVLAGTVIDVQGSMSGFDPAEIRVPLGVPVTIRLTSLDSPLHKGGGKHQLAIDEFGVDIRAAARESASATFTPAKSGTYTFYCDVCCGGRSSPSMQGKIVVEA
jgi:cytochrome c oxidase subunit 2